MLDILETTTGSMDDSIDDVTDEEAQDLEPGLVQQKKEEIRKAMMVKLIDKLRKQKRKNFRR